MTCEPKFSPTLQASTAQRVATWARHTQGRELLRLTVDALGERARVMPLKGLLLGALELVPPAERPIRDVDVLVDGLPMTTIVRRLGRAGFAITDIPWSHGYVSLAHARHPSLWLDVHTRLMPAGLGRLDPAYMFSHAARDERVFAAPVFIPSRRALMVQLLANVVKDRIVRAFDHVPHDVASVARRLDPTERGQVADDLRRLGLQHGSARGLTWVRQQADEPAVQALLEQLEPRESARAALAEEVSALEAVDHGGLRARVRARAGADSALLRAQAALFTAGSVVSHPLRKAWLLSNNRGDGRWLMR